MRVAGIGHGMAEQQVNPETRVTPVSQSLREGKVLWAKDVFGLP